MTEPPRILWMNSRGPLTTMMDNVLASRMGRAAADAAKLPAGDYIDSGLALLLKLNEAGFEVRHVSEPRRGRDE